MTFFYFFLFYLGTEVSEIIEKRQNKRIVHFPIQLKGNGLLPIFTREINFMTFYLLSFAQGVL